MADGNSTRRSDAALCTQSVASRLAGPVGLLAVWTLALTISACGGGSETTGSARSPEKYCEAFYSRAAPLREQTLKANQDAREQEDLVKPLLTLLAAPSAIAVVFDGMVPHAPDDIKAETVAARTAFQNLQDNLGDGATNPIGAMAKSLVAGAASSSSLQRVDEYLQQHCPLNSAIAQRYVKKPRPTTNEAVAKEPPSSDETTSGVAPSVGTVLVSRSGRGRFNVVTNGTGFSIVNSVLDLSGGDAADLSTITTHDASGRQLAEIPSGSFTGECGAADIMVGGGNRLIITELVSTEPAQGIKPEQSALDLTAWDATTGEQVWTTSILSGQKERTSCSAYDGQLQEFAATHDGRWATYYLGRDRLNSVVIDLESGKTRRSSKELAVLGDYLAEVPRQGNDYRYRVTDPETGNRLGTINGIEFNNDPDLAPTGLFVSYSDASSPPAGLSSDGKLVFGIVDGGDDGPDLAAYRLPTGREVWSRPKTFRPWIVGEAGGTLLTLAESDKIAALDARTGTKLWDIPAGEVCGITNSEMRLAVNGQLAVIDMDDGEQLSYSDDGDACRTILPGGIGVDTGSDDPTQEATIKVWQALEP